MLVLVGPTYQHRLAGDGEVASTGKRDFLDLYFKNLTWVVGGALGLSKMKRDSEPCLMDWSEVESLSIRVKMLQQKAAASGMSTALTPAATPKKKNKIKKGEFSTYDKCASVLKAFCIIPLGRWRLIVESRVEPRACTSTILGSNGSL